LPGFPWRSSTAAADSRGVPQTLREARRGDGFRTLVMLLRTLQVIAPGYDIGTAARRLGSDIIAVRMAPGEPAAARPPGSHQRGPESGASPAGPRRARAVAAARGTAHQGESALGDRRRSRRAWTGQSHRDGDGRVGDRGLVVSPLHRPEPSRSGGVSLVNLIAGIGLFFSMLLLLRLVVQILRDRD
jgi:hypothetical protein